MNDQVINNTKEKLERTIESLEKRFTTVRAGRANPSSLDGVMVSYYGTDTPLKQLSTISVPEARQLVIKPFDKTSLAAIEKAILASNLGYTPNNDGETIRIIIPMLTEERRKELTKQVKAMAEEGKVAIRNIRRDAIDEVEKLALAEDITKAKQNEIQELVNEYNKKVDQKAKAKEEELLTV